MNTQSVLGPLWNIGCKTPDVATEVRFLEQLGAHLRLHESLPGEDGPIEYAILELGGTRIFLTPSPGFEAGIGHPLRPGLTHAVFEVTDHDAAVRAISAAGGRQLTEPRSIEAGFGRRQIVFFESPGGLVFEALKIDRALI
jgi:catechol 2,3-dioxygenase-like lactoylglutathione lyase family enzyme